MTECLFCVFVLGCVNRAKSEDYLHHLCSLIHRLYFMHLVTRFIEIDPNTESRLGGMCVMAGFIIAP